MFGMWNVRDVRYSGCGMFEIWDARDVECSGFRMLGTWDVRYFSGCGMLIYKMPTALFTNSWLGLNQPLIFTIHYDTIIFYVS